jgi:SAM-dependent methyltransferase
MMAANEAKGWWDSWARYWEPLEDRHFGLAAMERVMRFISSPVLVVGAGHGIIVSALRERGLEVEGLDASEPMIAEAKRRRGLELVHGDARQLPFEAERFRSVIIASGVIDHHADEDDVGQILGEALRVLKPWGNLLVGFYRFDAKLEQVYRHIGVIEGRQYFAKRLFDIGELARAAIRSAACRASCLGPVGARSARCSTGPTQA